MKRSCIDCKYFEHTGDRYYSGNLDYKAIQGICKRFPPVDASPYTHRWEQPLVKEEDWCYEYDVE